MTAFFKKACSVLIINAYKFNLCHVIPIHEGIELCTIYFADVEFPKIHSEYTHPLAKKKPFKNLQAVRTRARWGISYLDSPHGSVAW